ncbi:hypothetical protein FACS1894123_12300 [Bacteroidia bacterium]|nr:hypothetical protein FACS1894123_12300 [Bacteroidia bacterium]
MEYTCRFTETPKMLKRPKDILQCRTPDADIFFVCNNTNSVKEMSVAFPVNQRIPELWDAYTGTIKATSRWTEKNDSTVVTLKMEKDESVFVLFPTRKTDYAKLPEINIIKESPTELTGEWTDKNQGLHAMTGLPEWFVNNQPRPTKERKTFEPWYYFKKDSPLYPAGLLGPVKLIRQDV